MKNIKKHDMKNKLITYRNTRKNKKIKILTLRILTGKKHVQVKLQRLGKV